jgi:flagellar hook-associated protein 2
MTAISSTAATTSAQSQSLIASVTGLNIDTTSLISSLVAAERQPVDAQINSEETADNTHLSGLGTLSSALSTFQSSLKSLQTGSVFQTDSAMSSNSAILTATPGAGAVAASHSIVVEQLATAQSSITNAEFTNSAAVVGTGNLTFTLGTGSTSSSFNVSIDSSNNTLAGIVNAINNATGNTAVSASIINVDSASGSGTVSKLVLTANNTGTANAFTVSGADNGGGANGNSLSQLFSTPGNLTNQTNATDAVIQVDGQKATVGSNTVSDVLQGVTLGLQSAALGTTVNVGVSLNTSSISGVVSNFVSAYNNLQNTTQSLGAFGGSGGTNGPLIGDATLEYATTQVRELSTAVVSSASGNYNSLAMIGITVNQDGVMSLDSTQLTAALTANIQSVSNVFSSTDGVAVQLNNTLTNLLQAGGPISSQTTSLNSQLSSLQKQATNENVLMDSYQAQLQQQFSNMDSIVGQYNDSATFLSNWIKQGG